MMCDCCAGEIVDAGVHGMVWGEPVRVCSGRCVARLYQVWRPTPWWRQRVRSRQVLAVAAVIIVTLSQLGWW